jgi:SAM-dependent methyltransferase
MRTGESHRRSQAKSVDYDAELRLHNQVLRRVYALRRDDDVLDIGCGSGQTTREAAREAPDGRVVGIDHSVQMIDQARKLTEAEGLHNVTFVHADAQTHSFSSESFDVAISRFGTMFFSDPVAAFANIGRALRWGGRLVMMVWQAHEDNEWSVAIAHSLAGDETTELRPSQGSDAFSLADRDTATRTLDAAGFTDVSFTDVHQPVYYGPDVATALMWVRGFACTSEVLTSLDGAAAERTLDRVREMLSAHAGADGIWLDARAWIVAARRGLSGSNADAPQSAL